MSRPVVLILTLTLMAGCPHWKQQAQSLQTSLSAAQSDITSKDAQLKARDGSIASMQEQREKDHKTIEDLEAQLASATSALDGARAKIASILADRGALRSQVTQMKEALAQLEARKKQAEKRVAAFRDLVSRFESLINAGTLDVKIVDGRMVVVLHNDILFPSGSADLSPEGLTTITTVAGVLGSIEDRRYQVEGHSDNAPIHTSRYPSNWYLASARAIHVVEQLVAGGLPAERVSAASYGQTHPVASNDTPEGKALNRRIEIVVVPDLSELPGYDELSAL